MPAQTASWFSQNMYWVVSAALLLFLACVKAAWSVFTRRADKKDKSNEVNEIVQTLVKSHEREIASRDKLEQDQQDEIKALTESVTRLEACMENPDRPADLPKAMAELKAGRTAEAEDLLLRFAEKKKAEGQRSNKEAAKAFLDAGALAFLHDTQKALNCYQQAVDQDPDHPEGWNRLGHVYSRLGELAQAEEAYNRVLVIAERTQDHKAQAAAYGNLGNAFRGRGNLEQAEEMHNKALVLHEALGSNEGLAANYSNLGNVYHTRGELDQAEGIYKKSLNMYEALGRQDGMAANHGNLGKVYKALGDLSGAEKMHKKALEMYETLGDKEGMAANYGNLGVVSKDVVHSLPVLRLAVGS